MTNEDMGKKSLSFRSVGPCMIERSTGMTALNMDDKTEHPTDLDSHADTCVVGMNALIVHVLDKKVNVSGFDPSQGKVKDLNLVSAALAYNDPVSGEVIILMINQAAHVHTMVNDLLCPMQMLLNDVEVNDSPKFLLKHPDDTSHALRIRQDGDDFNIPFALHGVTTYFPTRKPSTQELATCRQFSLTSEEPQWDPSSTSFNKQEEATVDAHGWVHDPGDREN
jgi:hypothetical protein